MTRFADKTLPCEQLVEVITEYIEGAMAPEDCVELEQHLAYCKPCVDYLQQMRETIAAAGALSEDDVPPQIRDRLLDAFRAVRRSKP